MSAETDSVVDRVYEALKEMAVGYAVRPGERINEGRIATQLGVSRTPLREALNRLKMEGFLRFEPGRGFFCRELDPQEVFQLYELRKTIETAAVRLAVARADDREIAALAGFLDATGPGSDGRSVGELTELDETFHARLMMLSRNDEMLRVLDNVDARIRFVRWIDMGEGRSTTQGEHRAVVEALARRDADAAAAILERHIDRRLDQITAAIREGLARIYLKPQPGEGEG
ncbi:GntR family transcriptional regulator [Pinisolibacter sp.]|uniref:GntR family transcriptional regulator n=1 Tax=Pinisolibacter sp. TaxID=2172024 RepID=UPI002FDD8D90